MTFFSHILGSKFHKALICEKIVAKGYISYTTYYLYDCRKIIVEYLRKF